METILCTGVTDVDQQHNIYAHIGANTFLKHGILYQEKFVAPVVFILP